MSRIYLIYLLLFLLLLTTCKEGADHPVTLEFPPPKLAYSPDTLSYTVPGDSLQTGMTVEKSIRLWNDGGGEFDWSFSEESEWIALSLESGRCDGDVVVVGVTALYDKIDDGQVLRDEITIIAGDETGTITVVAANYIDKQICASDSSLEFNAHTDPGPKIVQVQACGNWESSWSADASASWIELSPASGSSTGEWDQVTVAIDWDHFDAPQEQSGSMTLHGPVNDIDIQISAFVPPPVLAFSPETIMFSLPGDSLLPGFQVAKTLQIWNAGYGTLSWSLSSNIRWLTLTPESGVCGGETDLVEARAWFGMIPIGTHYGDIIITAGTHVDTIPTVAVNAIGSRICASDSSLDFNANTDPGPKIVQVQACGTWRAGWDANPDVPWIDVLPKSDTSNGEWKDLTVTIDWNAISSPEPQRGSITLDGPNDIIIQVQAYKPQYEPLLCVDSEDQYNLIEGSAPGPVTFSVSRCTPGEAFDWTVSADKPWVVLTPSQGSSTGEWDAVDLSVDWDFDWPNGSIFPSKIVVTGGGERDSFDIIVTPACEIVFLEPTAATQWVVGDWKTIRWKNITVPCCHVNLFLYKGGQLVMDLGWGPLEPLVYNGRELQWVVRTAGMQTDSDYRFRIIPNDGYTTHYDCAKYSDYFTITAPDCYVDVFEPNKFVQVGYYPGNTLTIRWITTPVGANVIIDLYCEGAFVKNIAPLTANDGSFDWVVEAFEEGDHQYYVKVTDAADSTCGGFSDWFYIRN